MEKKKTLLEQVEEGAKIHGWTVNSTCHQCWRDFKVQTRFLGAPTHYVCRECRDGETKMPTKEFLESWRETIIEANEKDKENLIWYLKEYSSYWPEIEKCIKEHKNIN